MTVVLDASAVLAMVFDEAGGERVVPHLDGAVLSVVNLAEVLVKHVDVGVDADGVAGDLAGLGVRFEPMTVQDAELQASIRTQDGSAGEGRPSLSLADRACLALGMRSQATVLTADRLWRRLALPVQIELIR